MLSHLGGFPAQRALGAGLAAPFKAGGATGAAFGGAGGATGLPASAALTDSAFRNRATSCSGVLLVLAGFHWSAPGAEVAK
jgi:hypothetical protein